MKGAVIVMPGIESVAASEVQELVKAKCELRESAVVFDVKELKDLCLLCYRSQSASRVLLLLFEFDVDKNLELAMSNVRNKLAKTDLSGWLSKNKTFKVECEREGEHDFSSQDFEAAAGELILDKSKNSKVSLKEPDVILFAGIYNHKGFFGIDFAGFDMSKRDYKLFPGHPALKGTLAYAMIRMSGFKPGEKLLDSFAGSGTIPIEAAFYSNSIPVNYYRKDKFAFLKFDELKKTDFEKFFSRIDAKADRKTANIYCLDNQLPNLAAAKKNSKVAGVNKNIIFSKMDVEWLDIKFKKSQVARIVSSPPQPSKRLGAELAEKAYKELFYQADYILSNKGVVALLMRDSDLIKPIAAKHSFVISEEKTLPGSGQKIVLFIKQLKKNI